MAYPRFIRSRQIVKARRTSGNLTLNSTAWADVDTGLDLTLNEVQVGDEIVYGISCRTGNEAVNNRMDVITVLAGTPVNSFAERGVVVATPGAHLPSWFSDASVYNNLSGITPPYTVVAGDLSDGFLTLRLRYSTSSAAAKTLYASTTSALDVWAMNLGPAQD